MGVISYGVAPPGPRSVERRITAGRFRVEQVIPQSVVAHRLWRQVGQRKERFLSVEHVRLLHDRKSQQIWSSLLVRTDTMTARKRSIDVTVQEAALAPTFRAVADPRSDGYRTFEQLTPETYSHRPSDSVMDVIGAVRPVLWQTVTSASPYRRYYIYLSPPGELRCHRR